MLTVCTNCRADIPNQRPKALPIIKKENYNKYNLRKFECAIPNIHFSLSLLYKNTEHRSIDRKDMNLERTH